MLCSLSGTSPVEPVISTKSGHVFEKRLILQMLASNDNKCPITGEPLTPEDLVAVKAGPVAHPRPANATSLPGMLQVFQNEWDALMLETFTLKQQLDTARQELAHALYQHDAACRVIARLKRERDEALKSLASAQQSVAVEPMTPEAKIEIPDEVKQQFKEKSNELTQVRRRRKISETLTPAEQFQAFTMKGPFTHHKRTEPGILCLSVLGNTVASGGFDSDVVLFDLASKSVTASLTGHSGPISQVIMHPTEDVILSSSHDSTTRIWRPTSRGVYNTSSTLRTHSGKVVGSALHCTNEYLATASLDQSWALTNIATSKCVFKHNPTGPMPYKSIAFHPDGLILGTGLESNVVHLWDVLNQQNVASFTEHTGPITDLCFSENGFHLLTGSMDGTAKLWDLRKLSCLHTFTQEPGPENKLAPVNAVSYDHSGLYISIASNDLKVYHGKQFSLNSTFAHPAAVTDAIFGKDATFLLTSTMDNSLSVFSP
ncbi:pre-mRNA-processing factor 19 [Pelomyxa schiedti]|nr:pre-mRNA-processing factor 19 [Pelomyxa schiedti]